MIVDDHDGVREALADVLEVEGYRTIPVRNGQEALEYLRRGGRPDLILLDLMMPEMTGWEFAEWKREDQELRHIPVVLLSGAYNVDEQLPSLDVQGYLRKPVDPHVLLQIVEMYCG